MLTCEVDSKEKRKNKLFPRAASLTTLQLLSLPFTVPVVRSGEGGHHHVFPVDVDDVSHGLQDVEVEVGVAGNGAVEAGLEEGGPLFLQHARRAAAVVLTNPGHPRKDDLRGIYAPLRWKCYGTKRYNTIVPLS